MDNLTKQIDDLLLRTCQFNLSETTGYQIRKEWDAIFEQLLQSESNQYRSIGLKIKTEKDERVRIPKFIGYYIQIKPTLPPFPVSLSANQKYTLFNLMNCYYLDEDYFGFRFEIVFGTLFLWRCFGSNPSVYEKLEPILVRYLKSEQPRNHEFDLSPIFQIPNTGIHAPNSIWDDDIYKLYLEATENNLDVLTFILYFQASYTNAKHLSLHLKQFEDQGYLPHLEKWEEVGKLFTQIRTHGDRTHERHQELKCL